MSDANDNPNPKLDRLLRQWGAEEAADRAPIGHAPAVPHETVKPLPKRRWPWIVGLGALAVAAAVVVGFVHLTGQLWDAQANARTQFKTARELQATVDDLQTKLKSARQMSGENVQELQRRVTQLADDANRWMGDVNSLKSRLKAAEDERDQKVADLSKAAGELAQSQKRLDDETGKLKHSLEGARAEANAVNVKLSAAVDELNRSQKTFEEAQAAATKAKADAEEAKARVAMVWGDFEQAYLAAAAPGETGLRAAQTAVRRSQLIDRLAKLRSSAEPSQRPLLDKLEVVLTRLVMLEPGTFVSEDQFRSLLHSTGILKQIEEAMDSRTLSPQARGVYFEARLILAGAERVG
jgi:DNA repair exonuclease SbcCD ATPase subunit